MSKGRSKLPFLSSSLYNKVSFGNFASAFVWGKWYKHTCCRIGNTKLPPPLWPRSLDVEKRGGKLTLACDLILVMIENLVAVDLCPAPWVGAWLI